MVLVYRVPAQQRTYTMRGCKRTVGAYAPLLELDLGMVCARLGSDQLLEVADGVVGAALDAHCELFFTLQNIPTNPTHLCARDDRSR